MSFQIIFIFLFMLAVVFGAIFYLLHCLKKKKQLAALAGLFCLAMGLFLLILDLVLITFTQGPQHIPDYLLFNRLVSDTGFAGRWMLTIYLFFSTGLIIAVYLLARNLVSKLNKRQSVK
ncbi:MAG: hypothetical protein R3297_11260 [Desulfobulbales bacterium]|nr:hypothetical protein [Desulfobulbales bacterium]